MIQHATDGSTPTLADLIDQSPLTKEEKNLWRATLPFFVQDQLDELLGIVRDHPEQLVFLTKNLQAKATAVANQDLAAFKQAIIDEERHIDGL